MESLDTNNEHQRRILNQYQSVTHSEDIDESIRILVNNHWNLELAVQNRYTPSTTNRHATTMYEQPEEDDDSPSSTSALLGNNSSSNTTTPSIHNGVRVPNRRLTSFFMWPFNLAWRFSWNLFQFTARLLYRPSITAPRRDPRSEADRFLREFESTYGTTHPKFFDGGYTQALTASKRDLKYMLVILCSEEHDDNDKFCRETLTNPELLEFLHQHQVLVWGGNVRNTEAFQVSNTLQATTYPFLAIIALKQPTAGATNTSKMSVIDRIEGPVTPAAIIRRFESAITVIGNHINHLRMEREQRELERRLRQEQDNAYHASLLADQEKERKAAEEREAAQLAEQARLEQKRNKKLYIQYLVHQFNNNNNNREDDQEKMAKISFRLANGDRVIQKFKGSDSLEVLYQFVEAYPYLQQHKDDDVDIKQPPKNYKHEYHFTIHSPFPRTVYQPDAEKKIIDEKGLWPSATLIVDTIDEEDDEE